MSSIEAYKFVKINVKSNETQQTFMLKWDYHRARLYEYHNKYALFGYVSGVIMVYRYGITENNHNTYRYCTDHVSPLLHFSCQTQDIFCLP